MKGPLGVIFAISSSKDRGTITEKVLRLSDVGCEALADPLIILFGSKFLKLRLREKDRYFLNLHQEINQVFQKLIDVER